MEIQQCLSPVEQFSGIVTTYSDRGHVGDSERAGASPHCCHLKVNTVPDPRPNAGTAAATLTLEFWAL